MTVSVLLLLVSSGLLSEVWFKSDKLREECKKTLQSMESLFDTIFILNVDLQAASKDKAPGIRIIKPESENRKPTVVVIDIFEKNFRNFAQYKPSDYFFDIFWKFIYPSRFVFLSFIRLFCSLACCLLSASLRSSSFFSVSFSSSSASTDKKQLKKKINRKNSSSSE
jgi:hypothetical protein